MADVVGRSFAALPAPMRRAMRLAWESACAGSLGIGAVVVRPDGTEVATGRNRLFEVDPGDDHLAGSSLAHAELNALAKLRYRAYEADDLELATTLQPCVQCLGAIRLSPVRRVHVLAPDPLWRGIEHMRELVPFLGRRWPIVDQLPVDEWSVLALLLPSHAGVVTSTPAPGWADQLPGVTAMAERLAADGALRRAAERRADVADIAATIWDDLGRCTREVAELAERCS